MDCKMVCKGAERLVIKSLRDILEYFDRTSAFQIALCVKSAFQLLSGFC